MMSPSTMALRVEFYAHLITPETASNVLKNPTLSKHTKNLILDRLYRRNLESFMEGEPLIRITDPFEDGSLTCEDKNE